MTKPVAPNSTSADHFRQADFAVLMGEGPSRDCYRRGRLLKT